MNTGTAQNVVFGTMLVTAVVVVHDNIKKTGKGLPSVRTLVALLVLGGALSIGANVAPSIAGPFALLVGLAVVLSRIGTKTA